MLNQRVSRNMLNHPLFVTINVLQELIPDLSRSDHEVVEIYDPLAK